MAETKTYCGTDTGYQYHKRRKESACEPCLDARRKKSAAYYAANKEQCTNTSIEWQRRNRDRTAVYYKTYAENHRDKKRAKDRKRKAIKKMVSTEPYTEAQVFDAYGTNCYLCDMPIDFDAPSSAGVERWRSGFHLDHFIPISKGGSNTLDNVRPSHAWCNMAKTNKILQEA